MTLQINPIPQTTTENKNPTPQNGIADNLGKANDPNISGVEPNPSVGRTVTKEINIQDIKDSNVAQDVPFDFLAEGADPHVFVAEPTAGAKQYPNQPNNPNQQPTSGLGGSATQPPLTPYINAPNDTFGQNPAQTIKSKEDLRGSVKIILAFFDIVMSNTCAWIADDKMQSSYVATAQQRRMLEDALVDYMFAKSISYSPGTMLCLALLGAYGAQIVAASGKRIEILKVKKAEKDKLKNTTGQTQQTKTNQTTGQTQQTKTQPTNTNSSQTKEKSAQTQSSTIPHNTSFFPTDHPIKNNGQEKHKENLQNTSVNPVNTKQEQHKENISTALTVMTEADSHIPDKDGNVHFPPEGGYTWQNPDPNLTASDRNDLESYVSRGLFPMYVLNKGTKIRKPAVYVNGRVKMGGRPPKYS